MPCGRRTRDDAGEKRVRCEIKAEKQDTIYICETMMPTSGGHKRENGKENIANEGR